MQKMGCTMLSACSTILLNFNVLFCADSTNVLNLTMSNNRDESDGHEALHQHKATMAQGGHKPGTSGLKSVGSWSHTQSVVPPSVDFCNFMLQNG